MKTKTKYLVMSLRNLRDMLAVAEQVVRTGPHSDIGQSSYVIYGVEEVTDDGQLSIESVRAVSSKTDTITRRCARLTYFRIAACL